MKPVCVPCKRFFRPERNGVYLLEGKPDGSWVEVKPGTSQEGRWLPYKVWMADLWRCQGCGAEIIQGSGQNPISQDFQPLFPAALELVTHKVNDC